MLRLIDKGEDWRLEMETSGVIVYLDNHSVIDLAVRHSELRRRFVDALHARGTLLFSITNAIEATGPQGASSDAVERFLSDVGPCWVPVDLDPSAIMKREAQGHPAPPLSTDFAMRYVDERRAELRAAGKAFDVSDPALFDLGRVLAWTRDHREELRTNADEMDATLRSNLSRWRGEYDARPDVLDALAAAPLRLDRRAAHVFHNLLRMMVRESRSHGFNRHDGLDFCHAVVGVAYSLVATLDKNWRRRARAIPAAERLARVYYAPELERLVSDLETLDPLAEAVSQSAEP